MKWDGRIPRDRVVAACVVLHVVMAASATAAPKPQNDTKEIHKLQQEITYLKKQIRAGRQPPEAQKTPADRRAEIALKQKQLERAIADQVDLERNGPPTLNPADCKVGDHGEITWPWRWIAPPTGIPLPTGSTRRPIDKGPQGKIFDLTAEGWVVARWRYIERNLRLEYGTATGGLQRHPNTGVLYRRTYTGRGWGIHDSPPRWTKPAIIQGRKGRIGQKVELEGRWRVDRMERGMPVLVREEED